MAKGKFRSNDYIFHPTTMGVAMAEAAASFFGESPGSPPLKRTARMEVNHKDGTINMIRYRPDTEMKHAA